MINELGHLILIFTLFISIYQLYKKHINTEYIFIGITLSFSTLFYSTIVNDFSVKLIREHSHTLEPLWLKIAGIWGNHEGSMMLWIWLLSLYGLMLNKRIEKHILNKIIKYNNIIIIYFILYIWLTSNPFARLGVLVYNGRELNPILQDPILVIHPPILYMGYIGLTIPFIISCMKWKDDKIMLDIHKYFVYISWILLTFGILLGSWWAYHELGWGGFWFWDPVENVALMPWIACLITIHNYNTKNITTIKKYTIIAYLLSIIGTFFVRSGLLASVHSFATDKTRGIQLLVYAIVIAGFLIKELIKRKGKDKLNSKEWIIKIQNVLLIIVLTIIIIGTYIPTIKQLIYPLEERISIGEEFFNDKLKGITLIILIWMILEQYIEKINKRMNMGYLFIIGGVIIIEYFILQESEEHGIEISIVNNIIVITGIALILSLIREAIKMNKITPKFYGHMGIGIGILAIIITNETEETIIKLMKPGEKMMIGENEIIMGGIKEMEGERYAGIKGEYFILKDEEIKGEILPEKRLYKNKGIIISKSEIVSNFLIDIYGIIGEGEKEKGYITKISSKIGMNEIWIGGFLIMIGGISRIFFKKSYVVRQ